MVYALINSVDSSTRPYLRAVSASIALEPFGIPWTSSSVTDFSTQLRSALADLKQTLHALDPSSASSHKRLQLNSLTVQLNTLDALLKTAIALLQPTDRRYLPSVLLPDENLEDIRSLFIEITETLQQVEVQPFDR